MVSAKRRGIVGVSFFEDKVFFLGDFRMICLSSMLELGAVCESCVSV